MDIDRITVTDPVRHSLGPSVEAAQLHSPSVDAPLLDAGIVDISELTAEEVEAFVTDTHPDAEDIQIRRRGGRTYLVASHG